MAILHAPASAPVGVPPGSTRTAAILGIASYVPDEIITNADLEAMVDTSDAWILERTGIRERRKIASGMTTSMMAAEAGRRAMAAAGVDSVDALIVATVSPDSPLPSTACLVQRRLGLGGIPAFDIAAACAGFVYGVAIGRGLIVSSGMSRVLVIAGDALTSLIDYKDRSTCVLFGDGAGAAVLGVSDAGGIEGDPVGRRRRRGGSHLLRPQGRRRGRRERPADVRQGHLPARRRAHGRRRPEPSAPRPAGRSTT